MRFALLAVPVAMVACATAGPSNQAAPDAPPPDTFVPIDMPPPVDMPPLDTCVTADSCPTAIALGAVSGDTGNLRLQTAGTKAAWYRVTVTEDEHGIGGESQRVAARVTSPAGADFDVFVYLNPNQRVVECTNTFGRKTSNGVVDEVKAEWGEGGFGNSSNDGREVSVEIRPVSNTCSDSQMWQLEVEGNFN